MQMPTKLQFKPMSQSFYESIHGWTRRIERGLKPGEGMMVTAHVAGRSPISVDAIGYDSQFVIVLWGTDPQSGNDCIILAHMSAVQLVVEVLPTGQQTSRKTIGFKGDVTVAPEESESTAGA
jgi:hypothetical protein